MDTPHHTVKLILVHKHLSPLHLRGIHLQAFPPVKQPALPMVNLNPDPGQCDFLYTISRRRDIVIHYETEA